MTIELADVVAWLMLVLLIAWVAIVLWATLRQVNVEARDPRRRR